MKIVHLLITLVLSAFSTVIATTGDSGYKSIQVYDTNAQKDKCWEAVTEGGYYYVVGKDCSTSQYQDWYTNKYGELKNRKYSDYCVHYDVYKNKKYTYLALEKCNGGTHQNWHYIDYHFVSKYDGYCVDYCRNCGGGKFEMKACDQDNGDQIHEVEGGWFYAW